jgi:dipeptidyl aminopeptidase/acylaminoacyl peptidase
VMNANGSGQTRITNDPSAESRPSWSPDGQKLAFTTSRDGNPEIYVMNADGSGPTRLTKSSAFDNSPDWQPTQAPPANSCGNIQGNGILRENPKAKFELNVRYKAGSAAPTGSVFLNDKAAGVTFDSTRIASFTISGDDATATGSGLVNSEPVTFTLKVHNHPDTFSLVLSNGYSSSGPLKSGRIEIHPC